MFIFIYNTLVLDVKRIDFEARMIDTLRSSSRTLLFSFFYFLYLSFIDPRGFSPIFFSSPLPDFCRPDTLVLFRYAATSDG